MAAAQVTVDVNRATLDLLSKIPQADRIYLEQMMFAAFCSSIRDATSMSDQAKHIEFRKYAQDVRLALRGLSGDSPMANRLAPATTPPRQPSAAAPSTQRQGQVSNKAETAIISVPAAAQPDNAGAPILAASAANAPASSPSSRKSGLTTGLETYPSYSTPSYSTPSYTTPTYNTPTYDAPTAEAIPYPIYQGPPVTVSPLELRTPTFGRYRVNDKLVVSFDFIIIPGNALRFWVWPDVDEKTGYQFEGSPEIIGSGRMTRWFSLTTPGKIKGILLLVSQGENGPLYRIRYDPYQMDID